MYNKFICHSLYHCIASYFRMNLVNINFVNKTNETKGHIVSLFISNPKESIPAAVVPARYVMHKLV